MKNRKQDYYWRLNLFMVYADIYGLKLITPKYTIEDELKEDWWR